MYSYILPDWLKTKILSIASNDMSFIVFSLLITAAAVGITMLLMLFNHAFKDDEKMPIKINKFWVLLFATPIVNIFVFIGSVIICIHMIVNHGFKWYKGE